MKNTFDWQNKMKFLIFWKVIYAQVTARAVENALSLQTTADRKLTNAVCQVVCGLKEILQSLFSYPSISMVTGNEFWFLLKNPLCLTIKAIEMQSNRK